MPLCLITWPSTLHSEHAEQKYTKMKSNEEEGKPVSDLTKKEKTPGVTGEDGDKKDGKKVYAPRRKFSWTRSMRKTLYTIVRAHIRSYMTCINEDGSNANGNTSTSVEEFLKQFLSSKVCYFWPKGWDE
jgi:hypothetical protein